MQSHFFHSGAFHLLCGVTNRSLVTFGQRSQQQPCMFRNGRLDARPVSLMLWPSDSCTATNCRLLHKCDDALAWTFWECEQTNLDPCYGGRSRNLEAIASPWREDGWIGLIPASLTAILCAVQLLHEQHDWSVSHTVCVCLYVNTSHLSYSVMLFAKKHSFKLQ